MIWYIAIIAIVNLALGYAFGVFLEGGRGRSALAGDSTNAREPGEL